MEYMEYAKIVIIALAFLIIIKFILNLNLKKILGLALNALGGFIVLCILNYTNILTIPINLLTSLVVGIFGLPGIIILVILKLNGLL